MTEQLDPGQRVDRALAGAWQGAGLRETLQVIVEGVARVAGFGVAALNVLVDPDSLQIVAVAGDEPGVADLIGRISPMDRIALELEVAEDWGALRFVPHERHPSGAAPTWVPDIEPIDAPDAWQPLDLLIAPLLDDDGQWLGLLSVDLPEGGRRPGPEQRRILEMYVVQASRVLARALEQDRLAEQVRLAEAARTIVRSASARLGVDQILQECERVMLDAFHASGLWIAVPPEENEGPGRSTVVTIEGRRTVVPDELAEVAQRIATGCWSEQRVAVVSRQRGPATDEFRDEEEAVLDFLGAIGRGSVLLAPLGAGSQCVGLLALTRDEDGPMWSEVEAQAALDIGHDVGGALLDARLYARDQALVAQLKAVDGYKSKLISAIAHEFKNPLTAIRGHLELIGDEVSRDQPDLSTVDGSLNAIDRGTGRLNSLVDHLLELRRVSDPSPHRRVETVDLAQCVRDCVDLLTVQANARSQILTVDHADGPAVVEGSPPELELICSNLVGNALKYTPDGGAVHVELDHEEDEVVLKVRDEGIGIAAEDLDRLFEEFYRTTNPVAVRQSGTGLGLAIVARAVERHHGTITVSSEVGRGSEFVVRLPAAARS